MEIIVQIDSHRNGDENELIYGQKLQGVYHMTLHDGGYTWGSDSTDIQNEGLLDMESLQHLG